MPLNTTPRPLVLSTSLPIGLPRQPSPMLPRYRGPRSSLFPSSCDRCTCWRRKYATVSRGESGAADRGQNTIRWPSHPNPSPYDIFAIEPSSPYTKARFYHLVKLYHPDRHHLVTAEQPSGALSTAVLLERYRLVVLANDILSDPYKRKAYDTYGAGWGTAHRDIRDMYRQADRSWRQKPGNAAHNATWEDWERWYDQRDGKERQKPVFMSNTSFVALVLATIAVGSVMQATRAMESASHVMEQRDAHEQSLGAAVRRRGHSTTGMGRHDRIDQFIRERENQRYEFAPDKYDHKSSTK